MTSTVPDTASRILDAALTLIETSDPSKLTLEQVAAEAGVHRATIFRHFPGGKSELLLAAYARVAERYLNVLVEHVSTEPTLAEAMVEGLVHSVEETLHNPTIAPLFAPDSGVALSAMGPSSPVLISLVRTAWAPLLDQAKARDEVRSDLTLDTFAEFMLRMVFSLLSDPQPTRSRAETKRFLRQVVTPFVTAKAVSNRPPSVDLTLRLRNTLETAARAEGQMQPDRPVADRLLENAAALFREKTYGRSSTRDLASRLGISQPSLYHHVGSKQELLERICVESINRVSEEVRAKASSAESPIRELFNLHMNLLVRDREMHLARVLELDALDDDAHARVAARYADYAGLISTIIEAEQQAGRIRDDLAADQLAIAVLNLLNWSVFWLEPGDTQAADTAADLFATVFLEGVATRKRRRTQP